MPPASEPSAEPKSPLIPLMMLVIPFVLMVIYGFLSG